MLASTNRLCIISLFLGVFIISSALASEDTGTAISSSPVSSSLPIKIGYGGNITVDSNDHMFDFRLTDYANWNLGSISSGVAFSSVATSNTAKSQGLDVVYGSFYTGVSTPPSGYLCAFEENMNWKLNQTFMKANVAASASFIGKSYLYLLETDSSGNVVQTVSLSWLTWSLSSQNNDTGISVNAFSGKFPFGYKKDFSISISFVTSSQMGRLNIGDVPITPLSVESIVAIDNFPYKHSNTSISLVMAVATATASAQAKGKVTLLTSDGGSSMSSASGSNNAPQSVYFAASNQASIDGHTSPQYVGVNVSSSGSVAVGMKNASDIASQVKAKYGASAEVYIVSVTFPPNATSIVYDPSIGIGAVPHDVTSSTSSDDHGWKIYLLGGTILFASAIAVAAIVGVIFVVIVRSRRKAYTPV